MSSVLERVGRIQVEPLSPALGGDVRGVDLARLDDATFEAVHEAFLRYQVLRFRDQRLDSAALASFSRRFGELDEAPPNENGKRHVEGHPEILVISNVVENGREIGSLGAGEAVWHTDMSYLPVPPMASVLLAREVPAAGGDTGFLDMYGALEAMPAALRARVEGLCIKHDGTTNSAGYLREGEPGEVDVTRSRGHSHPVVCQHPETGREVLYLGRRHRIRRAAGSKASRRCMVQRLSHTSRSSARQRCVHVKRGCTTCVHSSSSSASDSSTGRPTTQARCAFDPAARRIMHRTQVRGRAAPGR